MAERHPPPAAGQVGRRAGGGERAAVVAGVGGGAAREATVQTATKATTRLYVKTLPPGAQVTLDGKPLGASDGLFLVPAGTGKVSVQFDGGEPEVRQVEFVEGRITRVEVSLAGDQPAGAAAAARAQAVPQRVAPRLTSKREPVKPKPLTAIDDVLDKPQEKPLEFNEAPLRDVTDRFRQAAGIDVLVDRRALEDAGLDLDLPVTFALSAKPLAVVLDRILEPNDLACEVRDEGLLVTTQEKSYESLTVAVYPVGHLAGGDRSVGSLAELVQSVVTPDMWDVGGGPAACKPVDGDVPCLVIAQTTAGHRAVHEMLESLPPSRQPGGFAPTLEADVQP